MNANKILWKTLTEMGEQFTSNEFGKVAFENGYDPSRQGIKKRRVFLLKNAKQISTKIWQRRGYAKLKTEEVSVPLPAIPRDLFGNWTENHDSEDKVNSAIKYLKSKGYKIMKEVIELKEV